MFGLLFPLEGLCPELQGERATVDAGKYFPLGEIFLWVFFNILCVTLETQLFKKKFIFLEMEV